jgi:hypothetical protein
LPKLKSVNEFVGMRVNGIYEKILARLRITTDNLIFLKLFVYSTTNRENEERLWCMNSIRYVCRDEYFELKIIDEDF